MNGLSSMYDVVEVTPAWQYALIAINAVLWLALIALTVVYFVSSKRRKEN